MGLEQRQAVGDPLDRGRLVTGRQILYTSSLPQPGLVGINSRIHALQQGLWHRDALTLKEANGPGKNPAHELNFDLSVDVAFAHVSKALRANGSQSVDDGPFEPLVRRAPLTVPSTEHSEGQVLQGS